MERYKSYLELPYYLFQAGIHTDSLLLSLEPEAASLFCRYIRVNRVEEADAAITLSNFGVGDRYMILDCGGKSPPFSHWRNDIALFKSSDITAGNSCIYHRYCKDSTDKQ